MKKTFVVTLMTSGSKTDFGVSFMEQILIRMVQAMNGYRKSYHAFIEEVTGNEEKEVQLILERKAIEKLSIGN